MAYPYRGHSDGGLVGRPGIAWHEGGKIGVVQNLLSNARASCPS